MNVAAASSSGIGSTKAGEEQYSVTINYFILQIILITNERCFKLVEYIFSI